MADVDGAPLEDGAVPSVQGGRERGVILHKLIEEMLTGETAETEHDLVARAEALIRALGCPIAADPAKGPCACRTGGLRCTGFGAPEIVALRPRLFPEFPVYASVKTDEQEDATAGIADAIAFGPDGSPQVVIDWKSDVAPAPETIEHYRAQVHAYLDITEAERGLIVLATSGLAIPVARTNAAVPAA